MISSFWKEIKRAAGFVFYTLVCQFSGVGLYFLGTSNGWFETIVFG